MTLLKDHHHLQFGLNECNACSIARSVANDATLFHYLSAKVLTRVCVSTLPVFGLVGGSNEKMLNRAGVSTLPPQVWQAGNYTTRLGRNRAGQGSAELCVE